MSNRMPARGLAAAALAAALAACAATTHQIVPVTPRLHTGTLPAAGVNRTLSLDVVDVRSSPVLGYRGAPGDGTDITLAPEALRELRNALAQAYRAMGFEVVPPGGIADVDLRVELVELGYRLDQARPLNTIVTTVELKAISTMQTQTVTATFREGQDKDAVGTPSMATNAQLINDQLNRALQRMLADTRLTAP